MITASELAGFFAAHAIWCVSNGETLIPMLAHATLDGERTMERLATPDAEAAVEAGRRSLAANAMDADDAVLVYDARITLGGGKIDAIIVEIRSYFSPSSEVIFAVPYTPAITGQFLVHKPKLMLWKGCEDFNTRPRPKRSSEELPLTREERRSGMTHWMRAGRRDLRRETAVEQPLATV